VLRERGKQKKMRTSRTGPPTPVLLRIHGKEAADEGSHRLGEERKKGFKGGGGNGETENSGERV